MGSSLPYISIAYYIQKGVGWVQIACKIAYVLNGRPLVGIPLPNIPMWICIQTHTHTETNRHKCMHASCFEHVELGLPQQAPG